VSHAENVTPAAGRRGFARAWGAHGNERLTAAAGLALVVLLAVEAWTTLSLHRFLPLHMFLGFVLLPPVALKLASTGWRFARYYTRDPTYRLLGPPRLPMRVLAAPLVLSTVVLFGSGVALVVAGHGGGWLVRVHATSFAVWGVLVLVHTVVYLRRAVRRGTADWRPRPERIVPGMQARRRVLAGAIVAGIVVALATYPAQQAFHSHGHDRLQPAGRR
jgi:hypothetical protein